MPTGEDDCPDDTGAPDADEADFCDPAIANARTISWEKRRNSNGQLVGFATFELGGASGPFACTGDTTNPVEILDDGTSTPTAPTANGPRKHVPRRVYGHRAIAPRP